MSPKLKDGQTYTYPKAGLFRCRCCHRGPLLRRYCRDCKAAGCPTIQPTVHLIAANVR